MTMPVESGYALCTLTDVRAHLRMPATYTADDNMLSNILIPAAAAAIEAETDITIPRQFHEYYDGGDFTIRVRHLPILSVELCREGWGAVNYDLVFQEVNSTVWNSAFAYSIDLPEEGIISRRTAANAPLPFFPGESNIELLYTAGREAIPPDIYLAGLELIAHFYQNAMQRAGAQATAAGYDATELSMPHSGPDATTYGINFGVPNRILELLKRHRRTPIIG